MRLVPTAAAFLFFSAGVTNAASVEVIGIVPSSQNARITVLLDDKPQKQVKLTLTTTDGQPKASLVTDSRGGVRLPTVPPGNYCVTASADPMGHSTICLAISAHHGKKKFSMILVPAAPPPPTFEEKLSAAEMTFPGEGTRHLEGLVQDTLGAAIAGAEVEILPYGSRDLVHARKTITNMDGHFSYRVEPGNYTLIFKAPGFETKILVFDVSADAPNHQVRVKMEIGTITE
jgi:Carboxypeptidase regulatory-like domain